MNIDSDFPFPATGRIAAIDYGSVRIGVAICDPQRLIASPLQIVSRASPTTMAPIFCKLAQEHSLAAWVVGLPIHLSGAESPKSKEARAFARWLTEATQLPVRLFDERFTTSLANQRLAQVKLTNKRRKKRIDAVAAQVLLDAFIEALRKSDQLPGVRLNEKITDGQSID